MGALLCLLLYVCGIGPAFGDGWDPIASDAPDFDVTPKIDRPAFMLIPVEPLTYPPVARKLKAAQASLEQLNLKQAEIGYREALKAAGRLKDPAMKVHGRLHALYALGEIQLVTQRHSEAKASLREAARLAKSLGEDSIEYGYCLLGLASSEMSQGEFYPARDHSHQALRILTATLGETHVDTLESEKVLIDTMIVTYDPQQTPQMEHLLEFSAETSTPNAQERAASLHQHLAALPLWRLIPNKAEEQQTYSVSLEHAQHALQLWQTLEPAQPNKIASATSLVGVLQARLRRYDASELTFKHLLALKASSDPIGIETIGTVLALAEVMMAQHKAQETCELLQAYRETAVTSPHRGRQQAFKLTLMLAQCLVDQGQWAKADVQLREVEKIRVADEITRKSYLTLMYAEKAAVSLRLKEWEAGSLALEELNRVILDAESGMSFNEAARSYGLIGRAWWDAGNVSQAQMYFGRAVTAARIADNVSDCDIAQLLLLYGIALDAMGAGHYPEAFGAMTEGLTKYQEAQLPHDALWKEAHKLLLLYGK